MPTGVFLARNLSKEGSDSPGRRGGKGGKLRRWYGCPVVGSMLGSGTVLVAVGIMGYMTPGGLRKESQYTYSGQEKSEHSDGSREERCVWDGEKGLVRVEV